MGELQSVVQRLEEYSRAASRDRFERVELRQTLSRLLEGYSLGLQSLDEQGQRIMRGAVAGWDEHARTVLGH